MKPVLEYRDVSKTYSQGERAAVCGVNLQVNSGETITFVGESGSGKTTMLRLVAGLEAPDEGSITISRRVVADASHWVPPEKRGVGMVFQGGALFPHLTVAKNITYGLQDKPRKERGKIVKEMLELVGLPHYENRYPHELSGGERQRLSLARALAPRPSIVLLDEPFSNLDYCLRCTLRDQVNRILKEVGATSILVTHDIDDAMIVGDRIAVFRDGKIEQMGTPREITQTPVSEYCVRLLCIGSRLARNRKDAREDSGPVQDFHHPGMKRGVGAND